MRKSDEDFKKEFFQKELRLPREKKWTDGWMDGRMAMCCMA
jgi:hypothetical protein